VADVRHYYDVILQPAWRHVEKSTKQEMIAYRHSDVKSNITHSHADPKYI